MFNRISTVVLETDEVGNAIAATDLCEGQLLSIQYVPDEKRPFEMPFGIEVSTSRTDKIALAMPAVNGAFEVNPEVEAHRTDGQVIPGKTNPIRIGGQEEIVINLERAGKFRRGKFFILTGSD